MTEGPWTHERRAMLGALVVAPLIGVGAGWAALLLGAFIGLSVLIVSLACIVAIPAFIARRIAVRSGMQSAAAWGLAVAAAAVALVEAFALLLFLLSRANFD